MRIGILGDVHGNMDALEVVVAKVREEGVDHWVQVGDIVGYGAEPSECIDLIRELNCTICIGNHDAAVVGQLSTEYFNPYARQAVEWTRARLRTEDLEFLRQLPLLVERAEYTVVHGTLHQPDQFGYVMSIVEAKDSLRHQRTHVCFVGHSHVPAIYLQSSADADDVHVVFSPEVHAMTKPSAKVLMNVGSVGQPRDEDPRAAYAIFDTVTGEASIRRVAYDITSAQRKILAAGLPPVLANRLALGV
ncbi:MAG: metallophosphoesterase family protein [Planctomycetes bacterium]|nr:metallophosphoesterase family protein [Planctomycetota bacterium]MCB9870294.1 metallophosphoesterase family protein [Planctomycetota bacterium]MCB9888126.1 metallophosphoesterase family protein [Planctomycetota bacterium]